MRSCLAFVVLAALAYVGFASWFAVDEVRLVRVEGELAPPEAAQVRRRVGQVLDGRLLTVDVSELRERIMTLSWPDDVSVRKLWPDTLLVRVTRRTLVARWGDDGYLTPSGELVRTPSGPPGVPVFDCAVSGPARALAVYRRLRGLAAETELRVARLSENEIGEWKIQLVNPRGWSSDVLDGSVPATRATSGSVSSAVAGGPTLMLGAQDLDQRMGRFLVAWSRFLGGLGADIDMIDLRYDYGMAVRWRASIAHHAGA